MFRGRSDRDFALRAKPQKTLGVDALPLSGSCRKNLFGHDITVNKCPRKARAFLFGWDSWIRTNGMTESKSVALPLGYIPAVIK